MVIYPSPVQHALVAQMLQQAVGQNPNVLQQGGRVLPEVPDPNAPGDWSYSQPWVNLPTVVTPGYALPRTGGNAIMEDAPNQPPAPTSEPLSRPDGGYNWGTRSFPHASVFGSMRAALPAATRSNIHSHQQALIARFMRNQTGKARSR
jgi:hypothetical protein